MVEALPDCSAPELMAEVSGVETGVLMTLEDETGLETMTEVDCSGVEVAMLWLVGKVPL